MYHVNTSLQQNKGKDFLGNRKKNKDANFHLQGSQTHLSDLHSLHSIHLGIDDIKWNCNSSCLYFDVLS